jgi:thiol-disulfide isomerase/thioredoxin
MKQILLVAALLTTFFVGSSQIQNYSVGDVVSDFTVTDIHGGEHNLYSYTSAGKYVYIDFSFVNCGPCQGFAPKFNEFYDKYGCNNGDVICLSMFGLASQNDSNEDVEGFENAHGGSFSHVPATSIEGGAGPVDTDFNPAAYPTICLISPDNKILNLDIWPVNTIAELEATFPAGFTPEELPCTVGTDDNNTDRIDISVYPSPASNDLHIYLPFTGDFDARVEVFNLKGEVVATHDRNSNYKELEISVRDLSEGVYFARVTIENEKSEAIQFTVIR